ncbi:hypothetical protein Bca101_026789 [Brassica carinata]
MTRTRLKPSNNSNCTTLSSSPFPFVSHLSSSLSSTSFIYVDEAAASTGLLLECVAVVALFPPTISQRCSVCLGDYQANDKLQQIPPCGHTFHMDCIDLWLTSHTTCPLCRLSLIPKSSLDHSQQNPETVSSISISNSDGGGASAQPESQSVSEIVSHIDDGQEGVNDCTEVSEEAQENDQNRTGTSDACCNCRLG